MRWAVLLVGCIWGCERSHDQIAVDDEAGQQCFGCDPCEQNGKPPTTITGVVYDPAGKNPLYNVIVYVPVGPLSSFPNGVRCDRCGTLTSGMPAGATALTDAAGVFSLTNAPSGDNVPLVIQIGKWRKRILIPHVAECATTPMTDPNVMRLPATQSEGDMPQLAMVTGQCDPFECLLRKIGIDDAEFTDSSGQGKVHIYQGAGMPNLNGAQISASTTSATTFWSNRSGLFNYDIIINACECSEHAAEKTQAMVDNLRDYANAGGRLFLTHYHYFWLDPAIVGSSLTSEWTPTANFIPEPLPQDNGTEIETVNTSFPKGLAFAKWLTNVDASTTAAQLPVTQPRDDATDVVAPAVRWISGTDKASGRDDLLHYTFTTPWNKSSDMQCGKVLLSDFHVVAGFSPNPPYPPTATFSQECDTNPMSPQEKALEFMLFDLSSCIQDDTVTPVLPAQ